MPKVLVVDDSLSVRKVVQRALEAKRIEVLSAASGTEAMEQIAREAPDLVVVHGGQGEGPVATLATETRRVCFAVSQGGIVGENVASYEVRLEESAFLAGALAGRLSRGGTVGHLSGERVRPGLKGRAAFVAGLGRALDHFSLPLLGGDTIALASGAQRTFGLTAFGEAPPPVPDRRGAQAGDTLWLCGAIGAAGLGLRIGTRSLTLNHRSCNAMRGLAATALATHCTSIS